MTRALAPALILAFVALMASPARATDTTVAAGETLTLTQDLVLSGGDNLTIAGMAEKPCTVEGGNFEIKTSGKWTGKVKVSHCTLKLLGKPQPIIKFTDSSSPYPQVKIEAKDAPAIELTGDGDADINFGHVTFDECNAVRIKTEGNSAVAVRNCTVMKNALTPASEQPATSRSAFVFEGGSKAKKFFQGNRTLKGQCDFHTPNMLVGGDRDEDSNFFLGHRAKVDASGSGTVVRGNYIHMDIMHDPNIAYWSQVSTFTSGGGVLVEHNIIRDGEWIVQFVEGEFRYNVICDANDHDLMRNGSVGCIHHNLWLCTPPKHIAGEILAAVAVIYKPKAGQEGFEFYNNVMDGCDVYPSPGLMTGKEELVKSVRNNVFCNFKLTPKRIREPNAIIIGDGGGLEYSDYNFFYNPKSATPTIYTAGVKDKEIGSDGFAKHDNPPAGKAEAQVDPKFKGPLPREFPFKDEDILAGKVTMSKMLSSFRDAYTPAEGSPLIDAGDPADGPGTDMGLVDVGKPAKADGFGKFGAAATSKPSK